FQGVTDEFINKVIPRNENISYTTGWNYMLDINGDGEEQISLYDKIQDSLTSAEQNHYLDYFNSDCAEKNKSDFYQTYGGLFFIGILLSLVFMFATVLIIYYKQISEGYEDKENFHIMQMVGMNKVDIKKSINSQILTVFFVPLVFAVTHMAFAFPLIWKILQLFNLYNFKLILIVTICAILVFGLIYAVVYKITSNAYYKIVKD
ncbi:MAG: ABC transporter permease, partial [Clostridia bacterium]|nr:ABC transporter permease [Clostridia bacterium]